MADTDVQELTIPAQWAAAPLALIADAPTDEAALEVTDRPAGGHWLTFNADRHVTGCHCGMRAAPADDGWGDSVVSHLIDVGMRAAQGNAAIVPPVPSRAPMRPRTTANPDLWGKR